MFVLNVCWVWSNKNTCFRVTLYSGALFWLENKLLLLHMLHFLPFFFLYPCQTGQFGPCDSEMFIQELRGNIILVDLETWFLESIGQKW